MEKLRSWSASAPRYLMLRAGDKRLGLEGKPLALPGVWELEHSMGRDSASLKISIIRLVHEY